MSEATRTSTARQLEERRTISGVRRNAPPPVTGLAKSIGGSPYDAVLSWTRPANAFSEIGNLDESYRITIYDPTGSWPVRTITVETPLGSSRIRDLYIDYSAADQTADGYTPGPAETFYVDVQLVGDFGLGPTVLQEI